MTTHGKLAIGLVLCAFAVTGLVTDASALRKSWAEECNEQPKDKRQSCCNRKLADCYIACDEQFGPISPTQSPEFKQCKQLCQSPYKKCVDGIKSSSALDRTILTRPQTGKLKDVRICCKRGRRHWLATSRDCRTRGGRPVNRNYCARLRRR